MDIRIFNEMKLIKIKLFKEKHPTIKFKYKKYPFFYFNK
jgi:hypothetical protein